MISNFEKMVYILADDGIYTKITQSTLDSFAKMISDSIKRGNKTEGLIKVLEGVGLILEKNFPIKPDDTNELSNAVIQLDSVESFRE